MANFDGDPNILMRLNVSGSSGVFTIRDHSGPTDVFQVDSSANVTLFGNLSRAGTLIMDNTDAGANFNLLSLKRSGTERVKIARDSSANIATIEATTAGDVMRVRGDSVKLETTNSTGTIGSFTTNGTSRVDVSWDGTDATLSTSQALKFAADTNVTVHFGKSTATNSVLYFKHTTGSSLTITVAELAETGAWSFKEGTGGNLEASLTPKDGNSDCLFEVGIADDTRGKIKIDRDPTPGSTRAGVLVLQDKSGNDYYLHMGTDGKLYLSAANTDPGTGDTVGTAL